MKKIILVMNDSAVILTMSKMILMRIMRMIMLTMMMMMLIMFDNVTNDIKVVAGLVGLMIMSRIGTMMIMMTLMRILMLTMMMMMNHGESPIIDDDNV